ncbi:MAG: hypothetical protein CL946_00470 [Ectothiorhodospiraceae bacterium]|nr:hypothetical protein [Ectothiorhodospiraceae bacterium]
MAWGHSLEESQLEIIASSTDLLAIHVSYRTDEFIFASPQWTGFPHLMNGRGDTVGNCIGHNFCLRETRFFFFTVDASHFV